MIRRIDHGMMDYMSVHRSVCHSLGGRRYGTDRIEEAKSIYRGFLKAASPKVIHNKNKEKQS
ncbi:MAG: hypothetical protein ACYC6P_11445 [Ignavibacteriaceae bacterium]